MRNKLSLTFLPLKVIKMGFQIVRIDQMKRRLSQNTNFIAPSDEFATVNQDTTVIR